MKSKKILRFMVLFLCYFIIAINVLMSILFLLANFNFIGAVFAMIYPGIAPLLCLSYIICGIVIIRFSFLKKRRNMFIVVGLCAFLVLVAFLPYFSIPSRIMDAELQLLQEYGATYVNLNTNEMRPVPFSIYDHFLGVPIDESKFTVQTDILYLDNGVDQLRFDWYKPDGVGPFPVLISIHGGGFVIGDKGIGNVIAFHKYFASKGYVVFDLQYGLFDISEIGNDMSVFGSFLGAVSFINPPYNKSYTIPEMVENIGNFTKVLELNSTKYHADLNRTFIVGRSAGGHLASIVTLGYKNPLFAGNFSTTMNISGGIWYYPITDPRIHRSAFYNKLLGGSDDLLYNMFSAAFLIGNSSVVPPIMILHGDKDGFVDYFVNALNFYILAQRLNKACILVTIPFGGHAFDINFQTYGGQMSTYYMERFMALEL